MRPPQNAGENEAWPFGVRSQDIASMRPPQNAGENVLGKMFGAEYAPLQ